MSSTSSRRLLGLLTLFSSLLLPAQSVVFTELNYHSDSIVNPGDWLELHNPGNASVSLAGWYLKDSNASNRFDFPSSANLDPGAYLVVATDLADFIAVYPGVSNVIGEPDFRYSNAGETLTLYNASDAVLCSMAYEDTLPWQKGADGHGRTLEIVDITGDLNAPLNWFDGCMFGSPGKAYSPCDPPLVFSEINYNPPLAPAEDAGDWVELWNRSSNPLVLTGYTFRDQRDTNIYTLPAGTTLNPDAYLVLARDLTKFNTVHPDVSNVVGAFGFNLSGDGEVIRLFDASERIVFSVVYNDAAPWPLSPDGFGSTLELLDPAGDMDRWYNWFDGCPLGSPGGPFEPSCWTVGVPDMEMAAPSLSVQAAPGVLQVHFDALQDAPYAVVNVLGQTVLQGKLQAGQQTLTLAHRGICFLVVDAPGGRMVRRVWMP